MNIVEMSDMFDVLYNNITSNQAPGLTEYEKSVLLTKAEKEIVKNYFTANSKGNNISQGYDDSAKRQADFSCLMETSRCAAAGTTVLVCIKGTYSRDMLPSEMVLKDSNDNIVSWNVIPLNIPMVVTVTGADNDYILTVDSQHWYYIIDFPFELEDDEEALLTKTEDTRTEVSKIDPRSKIYNFPQNVFIVINEVIETSKSILQIVPLRYDEYLRLMSKPFKRPLKNQAWRLINSGLGTGNISKKYVEIIANTWDENNMLYYNIRYIRVPKPIILAPLDGLSIDGYYGSDSNGRAVTDATTTVTGGIECELDPVLHDEILQRAVELAKVAWTANGQENVNLVMQAGQRSE